MLPNITHEKVYHIYNHNIFIMKTKQLRQILFSLAMLMFISSVTCLPSVKCVLPAAPSTAPFPSPRGMLPGMYYQPRAKQSPQMTLDRLVSKSIILDKLTLYAIAVEGGNTSIFNQIFTQDAVVDFGLKVGLVKGTEGISVAVDQAVAPFDTAPIFGPRIVKFSDSDPCTASSITFFSVRLYGKNNQEGKVRYSNDILIWTALTPIWIRTPALV